MQGVLRHVFVLVIVSVITTTAVYGRSTDSEHAEQGDEDSVDFKVIIKREAGDEPQQDHPRVQGSTFRASQPLDPNQPVPQAFLEQYSNFEASNTIFQPTVVGESSSTDDSGSTDNAVEDSSRNAAVSGRTAEGRSGDQRASVTGHGSYSAPNPYPDPATSSSSSGSETGTVGDAGYVSGTPGGAVYQAGVVEPLGAQSGGHASGSSSGSYSSSDRTRSRSGQQTVSNQRTVLTSGSGSPQPRPRLSRYFETRGASETPQYSGRSTYYRSGSTSQTGSQYPSRSQYRTSQGTQTGYRNSQSSGSRGTPYNGQTYRDDNGHYIDENGRHLDSTGRYYDTSGRYRDAIVTRTTTYHTGSGPASRYRQRGSSGGSYDQIGTYYGTSGSSGSQYTSGSTGGTGGQYVPGSTSGTGYTGNRQYYTSGTSGSQYVSGNTGGGGGQYTSGSTSGTGYTGNSQYYSGGTSYPTTYDPIVSQISSDPNCAVTNNRVTINGLTCSNAISQLGNYVCYNYERVSTQCCNRCLQVKRAEHVGCEYGDRSHQCRNIQPFDCYSERTQQICCQRCREFANQRVQLPETCRYADHSPRCQTIVQRPHLCYLPDNQRLCCETCPRLENADQPACRWGNQNPEICQPFDANRRLKLNCYLPAVQEICCATCKSLRDRMPQTISGCQYGDAPIQFRTGRGILDCGEYIRQYGAENCNDHEISRQCCYTCYRYSQRRG